MGEDADSVGSGRKTLIQTGVAVIIVSTNEAHWLRPCLTTVFEHAGSIELDVVIADNGSTDGTRDLVEREFPQARVITCENHGFSHANNQAFTTTSAPYVVFLNPDTEIRQGTFEELAAAMDARPSVGLAGVLQKLPDGRLYPTIGRFPNAGRAFLEAIGANSLPTSGVIEPDPRRYSQEVECDWTSGAFMFARRQALESAGLLDERFFIYCEEVDLCYRFKKAGWGIRHLPIMSIVHHAEKGGISPRMEAQFAFARRQYSRKHFSPLHRAAYLVSVTLGYAIRGIVGGRERTWSSEKRIASRLALRTFLGLAPPPFGAPPTQAAVADPHVRPR